MKPVYLACHNRPVHEVLFPQLKDIRHDYWYNFEGMTAEPVSIDALLAAWERMLYELHAGLNEEEQKFLLSLVSGEPEWSLLGISHLEELPGIRWKLQNLNNLKKRNPAKFAEQRQLLSARLNGRP